MAAPTLSKQDYYDLQPSVRARGCIHHSQFFHFLSDASRDRINFWAILGHLRLVSGSAVGPLPRVPFLWRGQTAFAHPTRRVEDGAT